MKKMSLLMALVVGICSMFAANIADFLQKAKNVQSLHHRCYLKAKHESKTLTSYPETITLYSWMNDIWNQSTQTQYLYENGRLVSVVVDDIEDTDNNTEIEYNENGTISQMITYMSMDSKDGFPFMKTQYFYSGALIDKTVISMNFSEEIEWTPIATNYMLYSNSRISKLINSSLDFMSGTISYEKVSFEYDANGRQINAVTETSEDSLQWVNTEKSVSVYHAQDVSDYNDFYEMLSPMGLIFAEDFINENIKIQTVNTFTWQNNQWDNISQEDFTYDDQLRLTERLSRFYDGTSYTNEEIQSYTYSNGNQMNETITQYWDGSNWVNAEKKTYTYPTANNDQTVKPSSRIVNYPNPFRNTTSILLKDARSDQADIAIYNTKGQKVRQFNAVNTKQMIQWNGNDDKGQKVSAGIYFIRVNEKGHTSGKSVLYLKQKDPLSETSAFGRGLF